MNQKALWALVFTIVIWGAASPFARAFSLAVSPAEALLIRTVISGVIFAIALALTSGFHLPREDWPRVIVVSLIGMLGYYGCAVFGFAYAPAGLATLVFSCQPLMITVVAWLVGQEKLTPLILWGLFLSLGGTAILALEDPTSYQNVKSSDITTGIALMFMSCLFWTLYVITMRNTIQKHGATKITGLSCIIIAIPLLPFVDTKTVSTLINLEADAWVALAFLTLFSATSSVATWNYAAANLRPSMMGASIYLIPVVAIVGSWAILGEPITPIVITASIVILAGVALSQWRTADANGP